MVKEFHADQPASLTTVGQLLGQPAGQFLRVVRSPGGLDAIVSSTVLHDIEDPVPALPGAIMLLPGLHPTSVRAREILEAAAAAGIVAVVMKLRGNDESRIPPAEGVTILAAEESVSWRQLDAAVSLAVTERAPTTPEVPGDLFALAGAIAKIVGGAVSIEDTRMRLLAHSTLPGQRIDENRRQGILGRLVPGYPMTESIYRDVYAARGAIRITHPADLPRLAVAVRAAWEVLGSIWVIEGDHPFTDDDVAALERMAVLVASQLVVTQTAEMRLQRRRSEHLRDLLDGRGEVAGTLERLGIDTHSALAILAFQAIDDQPTTEPSPLDMVVVLTESFHSGAVSVSVGNTVYTLLPVGDGVEALSSVGRRVLETAERRQGLRLRAALATHLTGSAAITEGRSEVDRILRVLSRDITSPRLARMEDVRLKSVLQELGDLLRSQPHLRLPEVEEMLGTDGNAAATILAYLDSFGNGSLAAERLLLHHNTFRYRLRRALEQTGFDLDEPDQRLVLWLQLRLLAT